MRVNLNNFGKLGFIFIIFLLFRFSYLYASQSESESTKLKYIWREAIEKNRNWDRFGALKEWTKAIDIAPNNHYLFYNRGLTYANLQLLTQAIKDFNEAINLKPDFAPAFADRGMAYYDLNQKDRACEDFKKSAKLKYKRAIIWIKDTKRSYWCIKNEAK